MEIRYPIKTQECSNCNLIFRSATPFFWHAFESLRAVRKLPWRQFIDTSAAKAKDIYPAISKFSLLHHTLMCYVEKGENLVLQPPRAYLGGVAEEKLCAHFPVTSVT